MSWMFGYATAFNQDLCPWADKFPYNSASEIFTGSCCTFGGTPQSDQRGPFCASSYCTSVRRLD
jgi:hypothetical protein